jgi:hypothetical protein
MSLLHRTRNDDTVVADRDHDRDHVHDDDHDDDHERTEHHEVVTTGDRPAEAATRVRERTWTFAPGQLISLAVGVGFIALGLVAMIRAGIDGNFDEPTVEVLRLSHTAWLGLGEVALGVLLVIAGTGAWGRFLSVPIGALMVIAGVLVLAEPTEIPERLGMERDYGWVLVLFGALVTLAAMVLPVWRTRHVRELDLRDRRDDLRDDRDERRVISH